MEHTADRDGSPVDASDSSDFYTYSPPRTRTVDVPSNRLDGLPLKRKLGDTPDRTSEKRPKTQSPVYRPIGNPHITAGLPCEIWQRALAYLDPSTLASAFKTCHGFRKYLADPNVINIPPISQHGARSVHPDLVWRASRLRLNPSMPPSPPGCNELELFRLLNSQSCQYCHKSSQSFRRSSHWTSGPGENTVQRIWPFAVRSCGRCVVQHVRSVNSLLFSDNSAYSALLSAAPFAFLSQDKNVFSPFALREAGEPPSHVEINKVYFVPQLERIRLTLQQAQEELSSGAANLLHQLTTQHQANMEGAEQWERWECGTNRECTKATQRQLEAQMRDTSSDYEPQVKIEEFDRPMSDVPRLGSEGSAHSRAGSFPQRPPTRTKQGAREAKALRRADIERRCAALDPPITPALLEHMDSFQASMQIPMIMTDEAWELLKPKLLAQRQTAEQREKEHQAADNALKSGGDQSTDMADPENIRQRWETFQRPVRKDLCDYVDQLLKSTWADGRAINKHTAPRFVADALVFARNRYANDKPKSMLPGSAFRLVLHNMKWLYENKIKSLTDEAGADKELFKCAQCGRESKTFAFDSLIQHFGAKHTDKFGSPNIKGIAWFEALWPEEPPFQTVPDPEGRSQGFKTPFQTNNVSYTSGNSDVAGTMQSHAEPYPLYQPTPGPYGMQPPTSPGFYPGSSSNYGGQHTPSQYPSLATSPTYPTSAYYPPNGPGYLGPTSPFDGHGPQFGAYPQTPMSSTTGAWSTSPGYPPHQPPPPHAPSPVPNAPSFLQVQMDEVAKISRELWDTLSPVKQIMPSVRMYVILQHVVSRFRSRFSNEPNVDLFAQCLRSHALMQPLRNVNGLACKVCVLEQESREEDPNEAFPLVGGERKLYTFDVLLMHFKNVHVETKLALENAQTHDDPEDLKRLDWKEDMIELPEESMILKVKHEPGMKSANRLDIFKEVFPDLFKDVTPEIAPKVDNTEGSGYVRAWNGVPQTSPGAQQRNLAEVDPLSAHGVIKIEHEIPYPGPYAYPAPSTAKVDEYDPSRPSLMGPPSTVASYHPRQLSLESGNQSYREGRTSFENEGLRAISQTSTEHLPDDLLQSLAAPSQDSYSGNRPYTYSQQYPAQPQQRYGYYPHPPPMPPGSPPAPYPVYPPNYPQAPPTYYQQGGEPVEYVYVRRRDMGHYR